MLFKFWQFGKWCCYNPCIILDLRFPLPLIFCRQNTILYPKFSTLRFQITGTIWNTEIRVNFGVASLFTNLPISDTHQIHLCNKHSPFISRIPNKYLFNFDIFYLPRHKLWASFMCCHGFHPFTMEVEDGKLPFLDVLVSRSPDASLGHTVYCKLTHNTNRYLNALSYHPTIILHIFSAPSSNARMEFTKTNL